MIGLLASAILSLAAFSSISNSSYYFTDMCDAEFLAEQWWTDLVNVAHRYPIEYYPEDVAIFVDEFKIEIMDSTIQAWMEYVPWYKYPEHWETCKDLVNRVHSANSRAGALSGFDVGHGFPKLYNEILSEEEK